MWDDVAEKNAYEIIFMGNRDVIVSYPTANWIY